MTNATEWQHAPAQGPGTFEFGAAPPDVIPAPLAWVCGQPDTSGSQLCPLVAEALRNVSATRFVEQLESQENAALLELISRQSGLTLFAPWDDAFGEEQGNLTYLEGNET